uniref:Zinc/manganese transport system substrate-binding protein n=1 Tax=Candidatus Kentrum sp. SD TaxID=2126332 RepID=A0A451BPX4_9GAMM|nr:MAG: zinc/manganese transport system substrate-binding protein [Candidatus Kentron sp. SD]
MKNTLSFHTGTGRPGMRFLLGVGLLFAAFGLQAKIIDIFACEPEWASLAEAIGGGNVSVFSATTARQDPHHIQARPSLIAMLRRAELLICSGAGLEEGWLPVLLRRARNASVQPGNPGYLMAADHLTLLDVPGRLDRSEGDIHARGNPHVHLSPANIRRVAQVLTERMMRIDPARAEHYRKEGDDFLRLWDAAGATWKIAAAPLAGRSVVVHHQEWIYLFDWLGMRRWATLEPKPGIPPSAGHLSKLAAMAATTGTGSDKPIAIIRAPSDDSRPSQWLAGKTGVPAIVLPYTVGGSDGATDLFALFGETVRELVGIMP